MSQKSRNVFFEEKKAPAGAPKTAKSLYKSKDFQKKQKRVLGGGLGLGGWGRDVWEGENTGAMSTGKKGED